MQDLLIHIGYHRTGSTWLQKDVFVQLGPLRRGASQRAFVAGNAFDFDPRAAAEHVGEGRVLSNERFSGYPHSGGHDARQIADQLAAAFPKARILIVVREQDDMALSCYRLYVKVGGPLRLSRYLRPPDRDRIPQFDFRYLEYHHLVGYYQSLFDQVLVLCYEQLVEDPTSFVATIANFAGFEQPKVTLDRRNEGLAAAGLGVKRRANALLVRHSTNPRGWTTSETVNERLLQISGFVDRLVPVGEQRLRRVVRATIGDRFRESNRALAMATGLDLERYGYRL